MAGARVAEPPHGALERGAEPRALDLYALWSGPSGEDLSGHGWTAEVTSAAAGDCPYVDGEAGACVATAVDACA